MWISDALGAQLDKRTTATIVAMCEEGANPEALVQCVRELQREAPRRQ